MNPWQAPPPTEFPAAPWPAVLKISSALTTLLVLAVGAGLVKTMPKERLAHAVGIAVVIAIPFMLAASILMIIRGFAIDRHALYVRRLMWSKRIDLQALRDVRRDPDAIHGSIRLLGNGGLYSFSGIYRSKRLGRYRLFATDASRAVVLTTATKTIVVTPADPEAFIQRARTLFPGVGKTPNEGWRSTPGRGTPPTS